MNAKGVNNPSPEDRPADENASTGCSAPCDPGIDRPAKCFCRLPMDQLAKWARRKYLDGRTTMELMAEAANSRERELVTVVALLEVEEHELDRLLHHATGPNCRLDKCRKLVRDWVKEMAMRGDTAEGT